MKILPVSQEEEFQEAIKQAKDSGYCDNPPVTRVGGRREEDKKPDEHVHERKGIVKNVLIEQFCSLYKGYQNALVQQGKSQYRAYPTQIDRPGNFPGQEGRKERR